MRLHILTRGYRYDLLPHVANSIEAALADAKFPWVWWVACDRERTREVPNWANVVGFGPQADRWATDRFQALLGMIDDGYVYGLDDDNAIHPNFRSAFEYCADRFDGFCMPQEVLLTSKLQKVLRVALRREKPRPTVRAVRSLERTPRIGRIDLAQFVLKRQQIYDIDWKGGIWDGEMIQKAFLRNPERIWMTREPACYYNYLRDFPRPWWWEKHENGAKE